MSAAAWTEPRNWFRAEGAQPGPDGRSAVIFDLDGVISNAWHRQTYLRRPRQDWYGFFMAAKDDPPIAAGLGLVKSVAARGEHHVVICTARPHYVADITRQWLTSHGVYPDLLIIRPRRDRRSSADFKRHEVGRMREAGYEPVLAIDDDELIIAMYQSEGIFALYHHSGYYERPKSNS